MRQIHPVGFREKFVASGVYSFYKDSLTIGIMEHWSIHQLPDGSEFIRIDHHSRIGHDGPAEDSTMLVEALKETGGRLARFDVHTYGSVNGAFRVMKASYTLDKGHIYIGHTLDANPRQQIEVALPADTIVDPGTRLFLGFTIGQVAQYKGGDVFVFDAQAVRESGYSIKKLSAIALDEQAQDIDGRTVPARRYQFRYLVAKGSAFAWLDKHNILLRCEFPRGLTTVLTQYARRPAPLES